VILFDNQFDGADGSLSCLKVGLLLLLLKLVLVLEGVRYIVLVLQLVLQSIWQCAETKKGLIGVSKQ
jgi:hypothetical protein